MLDNFRTQEVRFCTQSIVSNFKKLSNRNKTFVYCWGFTKLFLKERLLFNNLFASEVGNNLLAPASQSSSLPHNKTIKILKYLFALSGALIVIMVYYIPIYPQ